MAEHRKNAGEPPSGEYPVGYKRPPKKNQFVPGTSGNKSGRPKKVKTEKETIEALLRKEFKVGDTTLTGREVTIQRLFQGAAKGEVGLTRTFFERIDSSGAGRDDALPDLTTIDKEILADLRARLAPAAAAAGGKDEDYGRR
jgi:hypothetical protein